ncbi:MAG: DUF6777 domain-containing protein [Fimbriimonadaceae bacterium]
MNRILIAVGLAAAVGAASLSEARTERNSFLNRPVSSVAALVDQVNRDSEVFDRYSRHFAMTRAELVDYLSSLRPARLEQTGTFIVYGVPDNGRIHSTVQRLVAGERIFVDASGSPVILVRCGNPLTRGPNQVSAAEIVPQSTSPLAELRIVPEEILPAEIEQAFAQIPTEPSLVDLPSAPTEPPAEVPAVPTVTGGSSDISIIGGGNLGWLAAVPTAFLIVNQSSTAPTPVPEPGTIAALALGLGVLAASRRRRKS